MSLAPFPALDAALWIAVRAALALLFLWTAVHKLRDVGSFRKSVSGYDLLPQFLLGVAPVLLIAAELVVGVTLISTASVASALGAAVLLSLYSAAIAINLARGRRVDCGCTGPAARRPLSGALLTRNVLLMALALTAALPPLARPFNWIDVVTIASCIAVMALLYATLDTFLANSARLEQLHLSLSPLPPGEAG